MNNNEIIEAVKLGMRNTAHDIHLMKFNSGGKINIEYVATVSIGQSILHSKSFRYDDNELNFEYKTGDFITSTVPSVKRIKTKNNISRNIIRKKAEVIRKGRIDIALLGSRNGLKYPICAIEVKGNTPNKNRFIDDIRRNIEYFKHKDATGFSMLSLTINCAFESYNKDDNNSYYITEKERNEFIEKIKTKYNNYIDKIKNEIPKYVTIKVDIFSVSQLLATQVGTQDEYDLIEDGIHLSVGIMITMFQKLKINNIRTDITNGVYHQNIYINIFKFL